MAAEPGTSDWRKSLKSPPLTPEERESALKAFNEADYYAGMKEIEETGGLGLNDFLHTLRQAATSQARSEK